MKQSFFHRLLLFHFFNEAFRRYPKLFYFFLLLTGLQLALTVLKLEVTPFLLYGMYSEKSRPDTIINRQTILLDGRDLYTFPLPLREEIFLATTLENYVLQKRNGGKDPLQSRIENRYAFFTTTVVYPFLQDKIFNPPATLPQFEQWFKQRSAKAIRQPVQSVTVVNQVYHFSPYSASLKLQAVDTLHKF